MIKHWLLFVIFGLLIPFLITGESHALQQVAGPIIVEIKPGETKTFQWGLGSDSDNITTVELRAEGEGGEFLSFPNTLNIEPRQLAYVEVTVTIPSDYPGDVQLNPSIYAAELGETGGAVVINIQMKKIVTLRISPNENPEFRKIVQEPPVPSATTEEQQQKQPADQPTQENAQPLIITAKETDGGSGYTMPVIAAAIAAGGGAAGFAAYRTRRRK